MGVVDESGRVLREGEAPTPDNRRDLEQRLPMLIREVLGDVGPEAVGFGCKGVIDAATTEVRTMPGLWEDLQGMRLSTLLKGIVADAAGGRRNDAKAAMAGEVMWGAAKGRRNAFLLTLGTGVGGAILADGKIMRGAGDVAGHLGHITADPDGPLCIRGNYGCLQTVFSARAIEAEAWTAVDAGVSSPMTNAIRALPESG